MADENILYIKGNSALPLVFTELLKCLFFLVHHGQESSTVFFNSSQNCFSSNIEKQLQGTFPLALLHCHIRGMFRMASVLSSSLFFHLSRPVLSSTLAH